LNNQIEGIQNHLESFNDKKMTFKEFVEAISPVFYLLFRKKVQAK
jgi:hypothetical protein